MPAFFGSWAAVDRTKPAGRNEIVLNEPLAGEIGAEVGDEVLLRIGSASQIPADSALGRKTETIRNRRLTVTARSFRPKGLGRFALQSQPACAARGVCRCRHAARCARAAGKGQRDLRGGQGRRNAYRGGARSQLVAALDPKLADYGITIDAAQARLRAAHEQSDAGRADRRRWRRRRRLPPTARRRSSPTWRIRSRVGDKQIPYSTIAAIDFATEPPLGPFKNVGGETISPLADDEIVLNTWAAEDLGAEPGDEDRDRVLRAREHARRRPRVASHVSS